MTIKIPKWYFKDMENIVNYTQRIPKSILERLDEEAAKLRRSRTEQVNRILEERYGLAKPEASESNSQAA